MTLGVALAGVGAFIAAELPLPWLLGPLLACLLAAFAQAPLAGLGGLSVPLRTILGVAVGASITPDMAVEVVMQTARYTQQQQQQSQGQQQQSYSNYSNQQQSYSYPSQSQNQNNNRSGGGRYSNY